MFSHHKVIGSIAGFLLAGCDQSVNYSGAAETQLTGMSCDAKAGQSCQAGDVIVTVKGNERQLCDWGWQIVYAEGSDEVMCIYRGLPRIARQNLSNESVER